MSWQHTHAFAHAYIHTHTHAHTHTHTHTHTYPREICGTVLILLICLLLFFVKIRLKDVNEKLRKPLCGWEMIRRKRAMVGPVIAKGLGRLMKTTVDDGRIVTIVQEKYPNTCPTDPTHYSEAGVDVSVAVVHRRLHKQNNRDYTVRCKPVVWSKPRIVSLLRCA